MFKYFSKYLGGILYETAIRFEDASEAPLHINKVSLCTFTLDQRIKSPAYEGFRSLGYFTKAKRFLSYKLWLGQMSTYP